jgi:exosome complex component RRP4
MEKDKFNSEEQTEEVIINNEVSEEKKREIVIPGEILASGPSFLPGENTQKEGEDIIATRFGLLDKEGRLVKIIPLSGIYLPRKGNIVIGKVEDITFNGWLMDINSPYKAFLSITECRGFIRKGDDLSAIFAIGDMVISMVTSVKAKGIDLTTREKGLHRVENGIIMEINSSKVPRVIGKQGSMINLIKQETNCNIVVGQNGIVWIRGDDIESELIAKEAITLITEKSYIEGLTDLVKNFLEKKRK